MKTSKTNPQARKDSVTHSIHQGKPKSGPIRLLLLAPRSDGRRKTGKICTPRHLLFSGFFIVRPDYSLLTISFAAALHFCEKTAFLGLPRMVVGSTVTPRRLLPPQRPCHWIFWTWVQSDGKA